MERMRLDNANVLARLTESARAAAASEENMLASAEQILRAVGSFADVRQMTPACDRALGDALVGVRFFSNLSRVDAKGHVACSAIPVARGMDVSKNALFEQARMSDAIVFSSEVYSPVVKRPVIAAMLPLHDANDDFAGVVSIALDVKWLETVLKATKVPAGAVVAVFDRAGHVLAANRKDIATEVFSRPMMTDSAPERVLAGRDPTGETWDYASAPLTGNSLFVGFALPEGKLFGPTYTHTLINFLMPIFMIAVAWGAIWWFTDRNITQWIQYLRRVAAAYRSGHYAVRPGLESAPTEFRVLGDAMSDMAAAVQDRDSRLRDALDQKSVLIKEIHHRVKNNLQIVMSLLSLQTGQLRDPGAREALTQAQMRINALALVHRILHEIEDQVTVDLRRLIEELTHQVAGGLAGESNKLSISTDILRREVTGELAVPLALFTVEALTNIFKHAYPLGASGAHIEVSLREIGAGRLRLAVEDNGVGFESEGSRRSVGSRLITTFGLQVGGTATIRSNRGSGTVVELVFPDPACPPAVNKASAA
jgi:two-component sensor histidine kinase